jgi:hypothetical protein
LQAHYNLLPLKIKMSTTIMRKGADNVVKRVSNKRGLATGDELVEGSGEKEK